MGVVLGSFQLAGVLLVVAVAFGLLSGLLLIRSRRRPGPESFDVSLHLDSQA